jgi:excinuclease UvrABC nuclease subunit
MDIRHIVIPPITLDWTEWYAWRRFELDAHPHSERITPPNDSGVYEARFIDAINADERIYIGKASDLRMRVKQGLVKGKVPHAAGKHIMEKEDTSRIVIRWASTNRPSAVEEELLKKYMNLFRKLPKYVKHM